MADYKGIQGYSVQNLSSDPGTISEVEGQLWYNSSSGKFKVAVEGAGAWATAADMGTARYFGIGTGTQTAALCSGGRSPAVADLKINEEYNGTAWTEVGDMTNGRKNASGGAGTQTAALIFGTAPTTALVEEWNGTGWTEKGDLNTPRQYGSTSTAGTITAALCFGGGPSSPGSLVNESFDGTSWTEEADLNFARYRSTGAGTLTAAIVSGDANAPEEDKSETWNGTSWTAAGDLNEGGYAMAGAGTQSAAWVVGGTPPANRRPGGNSATEHYNGTSWTEVADIAAALEGPGGAGTTTAGLAMGGSVPTGDPHSIASYEWNDPVYSAKTVTVS